MTTARITHLRSVLPPAARRDGQDGQDGQDVSVDRRTLERALCLATAEEDDELLRRAATTVSDTPTSA